MPKSVTKVVYKPDTHSTDEYTIIVNPAEFKKWKSGGLDGIVHGTGILSSAFEIFHSTQGSQGYLRRPSKQQLENMFGTSKDVDVVKVLLERGKEQSGEGFHSGTFSVNATRGSAVWDNKGRGLSGI
ncbi:DUF1960-domain-containing protein [Lanmaoa asiatica]|nr:DUF1960-domain-containing protein [Lanmaoa asiatica]